MSQPSFRPRIAVLGVIGVSVAIAISSFSVVRAQRFEPLGSVSYTCKGTKGSACVTGNSTGQSWGVLGASTHNQGVLGESAGLGKAGVAGYSLATGPGGFGVYAESADTTGKYAALDVQGDATSTNLFYAYNRANNAYCLIDPGSNLTCKGKLLGESDNNYGVYGISSVTDGVYGLTTYTNPSASGVYGAGTGAAFGVYGKSSSGVGVYGKSDSATAVEGDAAGVGVFGDSLESVGVDGVSLNSTYPGVAGSGENIGVEAYSTAGSSAAGDGALVAEAEQSGNIFEGLAGKNGANGYCVIDFSGDLRCSGTITGGQTPQTSHRTSSGQRVLAYGSQATSATIEDFGTAEIVDGAATVRIDSSFESMIDRNRSYYVFLTPLGDTRGLYVGAKEPASFTVREVQGGHSRLAFDYRIVAHPLDATNDRLPPAPPMHLRSPQLARLPKRTPVN